MIALVLAACTPRPEAPPPRSVLVRTVAGPALPMGRLLARSVSDALRRYHIPATTTGDAGYVLEGRTEVNLRAPGSPFIVFIHWTVLGPGGKTIGAHTLGVRGTWFQWENGDPRIIRAVGRRTAQVVSGILSEK